MKVMQCGLVALGLVILASMSLSLALPVQQSAQGQEDSECGFCVDGLRIFQAAVESNASIDIIYTPIYDICVKALSEGGKYTCPGFIYSYGPIILYVMANILIEPRVICEDLHICNKTSKRSNNNSDSLAKMPENVQEILSDLKQKFHLSTTLHHKRSDSDLKSKEIRRVKMANNSTKKKEIVSKNGIIRFLQLADLHVDQQYGEGSPSDCGLYLCCRHWYNGTGKAGHYGEFHCDLPRPTLDLLAETLQNLDPQPDFIIYTGDNAPHDVWNETWSSQIEATKFIVDYLAEKLPSMTIYPAIGNHESWPESEYYGTLFEYQSLNQDLAFMWQKWVDFPQEALNTITEGSYYNIQIMDKLRLISFNSDYGYSLNFYAFLNAENEHYKNQLFWIEEQLKLAEKDGDKVLLVAHIPPGNADIFSEYGEFYLNITKRYRDTITGHLFGHTHTDEFKLVQDSDGVYGVVLIAPSMTPYGHINPSFRMFTMDASSKTLLGYEQYHLNVTRANAMHTKDPNSKPQFELSYTTESEYNLKDLSPAQWATVVSRFETEPSLLSKYRYNIRAKTEPSDKSCDRVCMKQTLCDVTNVITARNAACQEE